jgi:hypothetical protein
MTEDSRGSGRRTEVGPWHELVGTLSRTAPLAMSCSPLSLKLCSIAAILPRCDQSFCWNAQADYLALVFRLYLLKGLAAGPTPNSAWLTYALSTASKTVGFPRLHQVEKRVRPETRSRPSWMALRVLEITQHKHAQKRARIAIWFPRAVERPQILYRATDRRGFSVFRR